MVKLVDTLVSGTSGRKTVQVRVLFRAHTKKGDGKVVRLVLSPFSFYYLLLSITLHATTPLYYLKIASDSVKSNKALDATAITNLFSIGNAIFIYRFRLNISYSHGIPRFQGLSRLDWSEF